MIIEETDKVPISEGFSRIVTTQLLHRLGALHQQKIILNDLKPENHLIQWDRSSIETNETHWSRWSS